MTTTVKSLKASRRTSQVCCGEQGCSPQLLRTRESRIILELVTSTTMSGSDYKTRDPATLALVVLQLDFTFAEQGDTGLLEAVAAFASANLRGGDLVFVCGTTTLVCLLADGDENSAAAVRENGSSHFTSQKNLSRLGPRLSSVPVRDKSVLPRQGRTPRPTVKFGRHNFCLSSA